jgi:hypothetical protein
VEARNGLHWGRLKLLIFFGRPDEVPREVLHSYCNQRLPPCSGISSLLTPRDLLLCSYQKEGACCFQLCSCTIRQRACSHEVFGEAVYRPPLRRCYPTDHIPTPHHYRQILLVYYCITSRHSLATFTTMAQLNIHGDPMPQFPDNAIPSALPSTQAPTAMIIMRQKESDLATQARSACSRLSSSCDDMLMTSSRRTAKWPIFRSRPAWQIFVSQVHISNLSARWSAALKKNKVRNPLHLTVPQYEFENVDPSAMALILYIAHLNTRCLPQTLSLVQIIQLAKLAEQYDLNHVLIGYLDLWLTPHRRRILERGYEQWLYVAWQFGLEGDYIRLANHLAIHSAVNREGELLYPGCSNRIRGTFPPNAWSTFSFSFLLKRNYIVSPLLLTQDHKVLLLPSHLQSLLSSNPIYIIQLIHPSTALITSARNNVIAPIVRTTQDLLFDLVYLRENASCIDRTADPADRATCTARSYQALQRYLTEHGLSSEILASGRHLYPVRHYIRILMNPDTDGYILEQRSGILGHTECMVGRIWRERVVEVMRNEKWAASEELMGQMRTNGGKFLFLNYCMHHGCSRG